MSGRNTPNVETELTYKDLLVEAVGLSNAVEHLSALQMARSEGVIADVGDALMSLRVEIARIRLHHVGSEDDIGEEGARKSSVER